MDLGAKRFKIQHEGDRTTELLARFMAAQGIPYEAICEAPLQDLIRHLKPDFQFPQPKELEKNQEGYVWGDYVKKKEVIVTFDVAGDEDQKFLVFSTHVLFNVRMKKCAVYLRRLEGNNQDIKNLVGFALSQIAKDPQFSKASIKNLVVPSEHVYDQLATSADKFICFNHQMKMLMERVLNLPEFASSLWELQDFIRTVRDNPEHLKRFQNLQTSKLAALPMIGDGNWLSTTNFLGKSIDIFPTLIKLHRELYPDSKFEIKNRLKTLHELLHECSKYTKELSRASGSLSQVLPAFVLFRRFITTQWSGSKEFAARVQSILNEQLDKVLSRKEGLQYRMATLLDPRFGYRDDLFPEKSWLDWENQTIKHIASATSSSIETVTMEMFSYRKNCIRKSPNGNSNPLTWWANNHKDFTTLLLATAARDFYTIPAVSIDADYFFGEGGKFRHVSKLYEESKLDDCLFSASCRQSFRGRGLKLGEPEVLNSMLDYTGGARLHGMMISGLEEEVKREEEDLDFKIPIMGEPQKVEIRYLKDEEEDRKPTLAELLEGAAGTSSCSSSSRETKQVELPVIDKETRKANLSRLLNNVMQRSPAEERVPPPIAVTNIPYMGARRRRVFPSRLKKTAMCSICDFKDQDESLFQNVEMECDRLMTAHAALRLNMISQRKAMTAYKKNVLVVCRSHFPYLTGFVERAEHSEQACAEMEDDVTQIFKRRFCSFEFREWCALYTDKFTRQTIAESFAQDPNQEVDFPEIEEKPTDLLF